MNELNALSRLPRRLTFLLVLSGLCLLLSLPGCRRRGNSADSGSASDRESGRVSRAGSGPRQATSAGGASSAVPTPPDGGHAPRSSGPTPAPTPYGYALILNAADMEHENGQKTEDGGWNLVANGYIRKTDITIAAPVAQVRYEVRGDIARGVWPEVDSMLTPVDPPGDARVVLPRDQITTSSYTWYTVKMNPAIEPGKYQLYFRFYNNEEFEDPHEDRNAVLRTIEFREIPKAAENQYIVPPRHID